MKTAEAKKYKVAVVGGGASGLLCAGLCAEWLYDGKVALFEKNKSQKQLATERFFDNAYLGKKLLITGKGRCNLTNLCTMEEFIKNVPGNGKFLFSAFGTFPPEKVMDFFENLGVALKVERGNRVFPVSDKALDILNALKRNIKNKGEKCNVINREIKEIIKAENGFEIRDSFGDCYLSEKVVVCTGGVSYPVTGSTGDGYEFAKRLGHTVTDLRPSLVPLVCSDACLQNLCGLSLKNVRLTVSETDEKGKIKKIFTEMGEMLFTHFGISGPLVLSASAHMRKMGKCKYSASIDLKPALDEKTLDARILSDFDKFINKNLDNALAELLPKSMIPVVIQKAGLSPDMKPNSISKVMRRELLATLKDFSFSIDGFFSIDQAVVTSGGVKTSEINPSTMESKFVQGLYFAGEVIDVDAYTGGFNLQIAFSTAYLAAKSCSEN